jgi:thioredoxin 1
MSEVILNQDNFKTEVEDFSGIILVDFWAEWCGPCRIQGPIIKQLAEELGGETNVKIAKLNVDEAPAIAQKFGIRSIPTLMFFKNGQPQEQLIGVSQKKVLTEKINDLTSN